MGRTNVRPTLQLQNLAERRADEEALAGAPRPFNAHLWRVSGLVPKILGARRDRWLEGRGGMDRQRLGEHRVGARGCLVSCCSQAARFLCCRRGIRGRLWPRAPWQCRLPPAPCDPEDRTVHTQAWRRRQLHAPCCCHRCGKQQEAEARLCLQVGPGGRDASPRLPADTALLATAGLTMGNWEQLLGRRMRPGW